MSGETFWVGPMGPPTITLFPRYARATIVYDDGHKEPFDLPPDASRVVFTVSPEGEAPQPPVAVLYVAMVLGPEAAAHIPALTAAFVSQVPAVAAPVPSDEPPVRVLFDDGTVLDMPAETRCFENGVDGMPVLPEIIVAQVETVLHESERGTIISGATFTIHDAGKPPLQVAAQVFRLDSPTFREKQTETLAVLLHVEFPDGRWRKARLEHYRWTIRRLWAAARGGSPARSTP